MMVIFLSNAAVRPIVGLLVLIKGSWAVTNYDHRGAGRLTQRENGQGGYIKIKNKTDDVVAEIAADEYGNGLVLSWNRKGKGRTLQLGP